MSSKLAPMPLKNRIGRCSLSYQSRNSARAADGAQAHGREVQDRRGDAPDLDHVRALGAQARHERLAQRRGAGAHVETHRDRSGPELARERAGDRERAARVELFGVQAADVVRLEDRRLHGRGVSRLAWLTSTRASPTLGVLLGLGATELLIILVIVIVIFGATRLPQIGRGLGEGIKNFRGALKDTAIDVTPKDGDDKKRD